MALQSSGQITLANISDEFGGGSRSNVSLRALSSTAGLSQPDQFSDFYGLSAYTPPTLSGSGFSYTGNGTPESPYIVTVTTFSSASGTDPDFGVDYYEKWAQTPRITVQQTGTYNVRFDFVSASLSGIRGDGNDNAFFYMVYNAFGIQSASSGAGFNQVAWNNLVNNYAVSGASNTTYNAGTYGEFYFYGFQYWNNFTINNIKFSIYFELL